MARRANYASFEGIPLDLLFNTSLGLVFAFCARDRLRADGLFAPPASVLALMFVSVILAPVTLYLYWAHPAWTWMYMVDPKSVPGVALIPLVVAHCAFVGLGWFVGYKLLLKSKDRLVGGLGLGGLGLSLLGALLSWSRLGRYGSYQEFQQGRALDLMEVKLGYVLVAVVLGVVAAAAFVAFELNRDSRRVRSR